MSLSTTSGRRSMRRSPRTASPVNLRMSRTSTSGIEDTSGTPDLAAEDTYNGPIMRSPEQTYMAGQPTYGLNGTMAPLGVLPKSKDRVRFESSTGPSDLMETGSRSSSRARRLGRNSEGPKQEQAEDVIMGGTGIETAKSDARVGRVEESGDDDYKPTTSKPAKVTKVKKSKEFQSQPQQDQKPNRPQPKATHTTAQGPAHLRKIVDAAVRRSKELGNEVLGLALQAIYFESLKDDTVADLLNAVLSQTATDEQTRTFQARIKAERRLIKKQRGEAGAPAVKPETIEKQQPNTSRKTESKSASPSKSSSPRKAPPVPHITSAPITTTRATSTPTPASQDVFESAPVMAVTTRGRGRKTVVSPSAPASKPVNVPNIEAPNESSTTKVQMSTRNSKKRPSSTPEPSTKHEDAPLTAKSTGPADDEPPPKRRRPSPTVSDSSLTSMNSLSSFHSSPEPATEGEAPESVVMNGATPAFIASGAKPLGSQLKKKPEPSQKVKATAATKHGLGLPDEQMMAKKNFFRRNDFEGYVVRDSNIRRQPQPTPHKSVPPFTSLDVTGVFTPNARDQIEQQSLQSPATSSVQGDFLVPPPPGAAKPRSRAGTPAAITKGGKIGKRSARIKVSPMKKKNGVFAGLGARMAGGSDSPVGFRADGEDSDNVDFCVTCGESGELLCCDGCTRSFHFVCCDPPLDEDNPPQGEWYCHVCQHRKQPTARPPRGLFCLLAHDLSRHNATTFALPPRIRTYFEGVSSNEEGHYIYDEATTAKHRTRAAGPAAEVEADNFKLKDSKGNFVLCYSCGKSSVGKREQIKCDYCGLYWHLDCLDPPPANPPIRPLDNRPRALWKCPAHADVDKYQYCDSRTTHKIRRPRNAKVVDTMLNRGHKNDGNIEVENEPSDEEPADDDGTIFRLSEKSIKLDFIDRIKRMREEERRQQHWEEELAKMRIEAIRYAQYDFNARSFIEQRAALSLLELGQEQYGDASKTIETTNGATDKHFSNSTTGVRGQEQLSRDKLQQLVHGLVQEAPSEVMSLLSDDPPKPPQQASGIVALNGDVALKAKAAGVKKHSRKEKRKLGLYDKRSLLLLKDLINKRLSADMAEEEGHKVNGVNGEAQ